MKTILALVALQTLFTLNSFPQWAQVSNGMGNQLVNTLACNGNTVFAGTGIFFGGAGVFLSTNNGDNWTQTSLNNQTVYGLLVNGLNVFAGTTVNGVYRSTNNGTTWTRPSSLNDKTVYSFAANGNNVFAGTFQNGVYRSTDNGASWAQVGLNGLDVLALTINGTDVFAGTLQSGVYLSTNNGTSWTQTSLNNRSVSSLVVNGNTILAGTGYSTTNGVYLSTNNGTSWTQMSLNNQDVRSLRVDGMNIFAGTNGSGVHVSNDAGASWTQGNGGLGDLYGNALCMENNYLFAGTNSSVWRRPVGELVAVAPSSSEIPAHFSLSQNYPNPFNPTSTIRFQITGSSHVLLSVYDLLGKHVATLADEQLPAGNYEALFDGSGLPGGVYFYRLQGGTFVQTNKAILLK